MIDTETPAPAPEAQSYSIRELAEINGMSIDAVKSRLRRTSLPPEDKLTDKRTGKVRYTRHAAEMVNLRTERAEGVPVPQGSTEPEHREPSATLTTIDQKELDELRERLTIAETESRMLKGENARMKEQLSQAQQAAAETRAALLAVSDTLRRLPSATPSQAPSTEPNEEPASNTRRPSWQFWRR